MRLFTGFLLSQESRHLIELLRSYNMLAKYPEIIKELMVKAESDELRQFNLSSFTSDKSMKKVFAEIEKDMKFFSVYIFIERLEDDLWEDDRYTEKEEVRLCSRDTFYL